MICWHCHWGWPKQVADIYQRAESIVGELDMQYGPGHIVWCDDNFENENIEYCIKACDEPLFSDYDRETLDVIRQSLRDLLEVPEDIRLCVPDDYDDEHPENFPPRDGLVMVRV